MLGILPETRPALVPPSRGLSFRDIVFILFRRKWIILAVALPMILVGGVSLFRQTSSYSASSRVLVELVKVDLPVWNTSGRNIDFDRELSTLFNIAMSIPVGDLAATALVDSIPVIKQLNPKLVGLETPGALRDWLLGGLDVSVVGESTILEFRSTTVHPRLSLLAVGALKDAFVNYQVHGRKNRDAVAYYDEQITTVRTEIDSLLVVRGKVMNETGYTSLDMDMRYDTGQLADTEGKLREAVENRMAVEQDFNTLKRALDGNPLEFPAGLDESRSSTLVGWRDIVGKHQDEMNNILALHTDDSIPARRQQDLLDRSLEGLRQEERAYVESLRLQLMNLQNREQTLREQVEHLRERTTRAPDAYRQISLLDVEIESLRGLLKDLQGKRGEVRISELADERVSSLVPLTDPELDMIFSGGKTMFYFVLIVFFGIALGVVAALITENMDHRVYGPVDVEEHLQLPVFASVTKVD